MCHENRDFWLNREKHIVALASAKTGTQLSSSSGPSGGNTAAGACQRPDKLINTCPFYKKAINGISGYDLRGLAPRREATRHTHLYYNSRNSRADPATTTRALRRRLVWSCQARPGQDSKEDVETARRRPNSSWHVYLEVDGESQQIVKPQTNEDYLNSQKFERPKI